MTLNRRHFLKSTAAATSVSSLSAAQPKPNFLFLIADDLTFRAVHALGNPTIQTPNIDRLIQRGTHSATASTKAPGPAPSAFPAAPCSIPA